MKKFFKASSFFSSKFGKKKHVSKHDKEHVSDSAVEDKETDKLEDIVSEEIIVQEGAPFEEANVGPLDTLEMNGTLTPTQAMMINKTDEIFLSSVKDTFMSPEVNILEPIQIYMSSVNTLKYCQSEPRTKALSVLVPDIKEIDNVMHKKIDDLEKLSMKQSSEIEQLRSTLSDCLARIATLESSLKTNKVNATPTPNSLRLSSPKGKDIQLRKSMVSPRTPMKNMRASGTPTRRSASDLSNHKETTFLKGEGALKIFLRGRPINLYAPSSIAESFDMKATLSEPDESLRMEWVYGYRGKDCRRNMYYLPTGDLVYFVAGIVVLHNIDKQSQRHYIEHTDDIKCLALHPDKVTFASGQVASHSKVDGKPHVRVWSSISLETLHIIGLGFFDRAVAALAFSKSDGGNLLCTVDEANDHNVTLWSWSKKKSISTAKSSTEAVVEVEFHPKDSNIIVTCGKNHLAFWNVEKNSLVKKTAIYEKYEKPKFVTCIVFTEDGELISGDSSGNIFFWNKDKRAIVESIDKAHNGPVFSLLVTGKRRLLSGGGKDNAIFEWDLTTKTKAGISIQLKEQFGSCRAMCEKESQLLVGTTLNCIVKVIDNECEPLLEGHSEELWSLCDTISKETFVSAGFDKKIIVWDAETHKTLSMKQVDKAIYSMGLNTVSRLCVVGCGEGHWLICDLSSGTDIHQGRDGIETIQCCEFSPDGSYFALGSRDNHVYIYKIDAASNEVSKVGKCVGHSSFITHLDWSSDNQYLRTNSGDYELLFWLVPDCKQIKASSTLANVCWVTCNCSLSFEVAGVWPEGSDGTDINAVTKAHTKNIMATADDFGKVNLYRYPASHPKAGHKIYGGHSSHVTGVKFLYNDRRLASVGGQDTAIVQWLLV